MRFTVAGGLYRSCFPPEESGLFIHFARKSGGHWKTEEDVFVTE